MATWDRDNAPTWEPTAEADQLGWADAESGEVLVSTKPNSVNSTFFNQAERAAIAAWVQALLLTPAEAGLSGAIASVELVSNDFDYASAATITVVGAGSAGDVTMVLETLGWIATSGAALNNGGANYVVGDILELSNGGTIIVDTVDGGGAVTAFTLVNQGPKTRSADATAEAVNQRLVSQVGAGATFDLTVGFGVASFTVATPGADYIPEQTTITMSGAATAKVLIDNVGSGDFGALEILAISRM